MRIEIAAVGNSRLNKYMLDILYCHVFIYYDHIYYYMHIYTYVVYVCMYVDKYVYDISSKFTLITN